MGAATAEARARALALHRRVVVLDTHSHFLTNAHALGRDFTRRHRPPLLWNPLRNQVDLPRLRAAGVAGTVFTVFASSLNRELSTWRACRRTLDTFDRLVARAAPQVVRADTAAEVRHAHAEGRFAAMPGVEGGHVLGRRLERLVALRDRGVRWFTLTHFLANRICDGHLGPRIHGGLSAFGRAVLDLCVELGVVVDLAHASERTFYQALEHLPRPAVVTHTGLRLGRRSQRFLTDDQLRALAAHGGAVGVLLCPWYLEPRGLLTDLDRAVDVHLHIAERIGPEHLLLGTDMDGDIWLPRGMRDAADLPELTARLLARGFGEAALEGLLGANALRILEAWEAPGTAPGPARRGSGAASPPRCGPSGA